MWLIISSCNLFFFKNCVNMVGDSVFGLNVFVVVSKLLK